MSQLQVILVGAAVSVVVGIIAFFLKRTISRVDDHDRQIQEVKENYVAKSGLDRFESAIKEDACTLKAEHKERIDKLQTDVERIKEDYITKEDFFRENTKMERKLDTILDILLKMRSGGTNG